MSVKTISAKEFVEHFRRGEPCVVDLRTAAENRAEQLEQSVLLPVQDLSPYTFENCIKDRQWQNKPVYLLCQSGKRAEIACSKLGETDRELIIIQGGLNALKEAGVETVKSDRKVVSLERQVRICAGGLVVLGGVLALLLNPAFVWLSIFIGAGLTFAGISDTCGMALVLARMPWNRA